MNDRIRDSIAQLLQLCGDDPSAAFARQHNALPLVRRSEGWIAIRTDGGIVFVDEATGRTIDDVPDDWRSEAQDVAQQRYHIDSEPPE